MLKLFEVSGFKNFHNTFRLDFSDVRDYKFNTECITDGRISKLIMYGRNGIGKSNFGLALFDIVLHLTSRNDVPNLYDYYLNNYADTRYASFHYVFEFGNSVIDYEYRKADAHDLQYEKVLVDGVTLYEYDYVHKTGDLSGVYEITPTLVFEYIGTDCILRYIVNNTMLADTHPLKQMLSFVNRMLWFRVSDENEHIGYKNTTDDYSSFMIDNEWITEFENLLVRAGISCRLIAKESYDGVRRLYFDGNILLSFFTTASSGAKALYTLYYWLKSASDISLIFLDNFDAYYNFELGEIVTSILLQLSNTQVILTSHNTHLLTNRLMRPDCYFLLANDRLVSLANATNRELREGHNLEKLYIGGEFE